MYPVSYREVITPVSQPWVRHCLEALKNGSCVLVTLRQHKGSSPRESGTRMVVSKDAFFGSIGGGNLEHIATNTAREMLSRHFENATPTRHPGNAESVIRDPVLSPRLEPYGLGPHLNQCCGGAVELLFEVITSTPEWLSELVIALERGDHAVLATAASGNEAVHHLALPVGRESNLPADLREPIRAMLDGDGGDPFQVLQAEGKDWWIQRMARHRASLWLFGAGHVGKAVVKALADLPFEVTWLDNRSQEYPEQVPSNVEIQVTDNPVAAVSQAPASAIFIIMTHSHELDEDLCHAVMDRNDFAFLGMIGSKSKASRFRHRLGKRGISQALLERLVCPIGLPNITGKEPATIALGLAAQLMSRDKD